MGGGLLNTVELRERGEFYNMLCFYCPRVAVFQKLSSVYTFIYCLGYTLLSVSILLPRIPSITVTVERDYGLSAYAKCNPRFLFLGGGGELFWIYPIQSQGFR